MDDFCQAIAGIFQLHFEVSCDGGFSYKSIVHLLGMHFLDFRFQGEGVHIVPSPTAVRDSHRPNRIGVAKAVYAGAF